MPVHADLSGIQRLVAGLRKLERVGARVGVEAGASEDDGTPIGEIATYLENGWTQSVTPRQAGWFRAQGFPMAVGATLTLPARPSFHHTAERNGEKWQRLAGNILKKRADEFAKDPEGVGTAALAMAAQVAQEDLQETIRTNGHGEFAPRSPLTMAMYAQTMQGHRSGGANHDPTNNTETDKALVHTGKFLHSIIFEITRGKG